MRQFPSAEILKAEFGQMVRAADKRRKTAVCGGVFGYDKEFDFIFKIQ